LSIPAFNEHGLLPVGLHEATVEEVRARFGTFQSTERRPLLSAKLVELLREAKNCRAVLAVILDGSFITSEPNPNDIDLVFVLINGYDFSAELSPSQYNVLSQRQVRRRYGFDIVVVEDGSESMHEAIAFFEQVRQRPGLKKGLVRIEI
jgi:hypothetical protein